MRIHHLSMAIWFGLVSHSSVASQLQHSLAQEPYSGLFKAPNAEVADFGQFQFGLSNPVEFKRRYIDGYNYMPTFGLFPGLEVVGRIATQDNNSNCYVEGCGIRDLSASAKYQLPFIPVEWFDAAVGARDLGGAANNFRAYYAVMSKEWWQLRLSAGLGSSESQLGQLDGLFGGVEWQPWEWLQLVSEYDANSINAGAKLYTPHAWLPQGWQLYASWQAYQQEDRAGKEQWWGIGVKLPMALGTESARYTTQSGFTADDIADARASLASVSQQEDNQSTATVTAVSTSAPTEKEGSSAEEKSDGVDLLIALLSQAGFENIKAAVIDKQLVVALENNRYNWNELDGLGVALGIIADHAPAVSSDLELILLNQKLPVLAVNSSLACTQAYLQDSGSCGEKDAFFATSTRNLAAKLAKLDKQNLHTSSTFKPRLILAPAIRSNVATEYGVFDYSLALSSNLQLPMWQGAMFDVRHFLPLSNSDDFNDGKIWANNRYHSEVDRVLVHQAFWLPADLFTKFSAGRMLSDYDGVQNETRWESELGVHRLKFESAWFENDKSHDTAKPVLGSYRYFKADWDWAGEITAGQFWEGDKGYKLVSKHWFGDTEVRLFFRDTTQKIAGLEVIVPLTFRQDMKPTRFGQVRGTEQFAYGVETLVGETHNQLTSGVAITPSLAHNVDQVYFNRDRLSPAYIEANLSRMRASYQKYVK